MQVNVVHETTICVCCVNVHWVHVWNAAWLPLWKKISITTAISILENIQWIFYVSAGLFPWRTNLKYSFYNILTEIYKGELKKDTRFCKHISFFLKRFKNHISALGFSSPMLSSETRIHSVYLSELLGIKAVTFKKAISHRVTNVRHSL